MAVKKFIKFDSEKGYLDNKDDINYFATNQMRKIAFGKMLGDFDENGLYVVKEKIVEELIKMPKVIVEIVEGADLIRSKVKADTFFHFILTVEDNKASLKLLEKINYQSNRNFNSGTYSNINEYVLDEVIVPDKDFDRNALYEKYNIATENDGEVLSIFDMDELTLALYFNIIEKIKINYLVQNALMLKEKELENIEADYFEAVLNMFEEFRDFGDKVTNSVKQNLAEKHSFVIVSKPFFQHAINEIMDSYIERYLQELSSEEKEQILTRLREIKENYYQKFKTLLPIEIVKKAGIKLGNSQELQGELAEEIEPKTFTTSDVRRILINDDELQLSINKIKEMIAEQEEVCKRDNAKAKDILKGREKTSEFYGELEKENKVDILTPDKPLIQTKIEQNVANKSDEKAKAVVGDGKSAEKPQQKKPTAKAGVKKGNSASSKPSSKKPKPKQDAKQQKSAPVTTNKKEENKFTFIPGSPVILQEGNKEDLEKLKNKLRGVRFDKQGTHIAQNKQAEQKNEGLEL